MLRDIGRTGHGGPLGVREDLLIEGEWVPGSGGDRLAVTDPASREQIASVASARPEDVRRAIAAAKHAFLAWSRLLARERAAVLRRWHELIVGNADDLARIVTAEQGKPLTEARGEVLYGSCFVEWFAEEAKRGYRDVVPSNQQNRRIVVTKQPIGVCAAITPWNFPSAMILRKAGAALAAGARWWSSRRARHRYPRWRSPSSPRRRACRQVCSMSYTVRRPRSVPSARRVPTFGQAHVARARWQRPADRLRRRRSGARARGSDGLEVSATLARHACARTASSCSPGVHDASVARLSEAASQLKVGRGFEPGVEQGPLISEDAVAKVERHIADALGRGARLELGGSRHELGVTFFEPTVLSRATPEMLLAREETFGPVAAVFRFDTEEEAVELANSTESGLSAYFFSRDLARARRVGEALDFGVVGINTGVISSEGAPFSGVKESGLGREGSRHGLDDCLELKYVCFEGLG